MALALPKPLVTTGNKLAFNLTPRARHDRERMFNPLFSNATVESLRGQQNAAFAKAANAHRMSILGHKGRSAQKVRKAS